MIKWIFLLVALPLMWVGIKKHWFRKLFAPFRCWVIYWVNIKTLTTTFLVCSIIATATIGAYIQWNEPVQTSYDTQDILQSDSSRNVMSFMENAAESILVGISTVFQVLSGEYDVLYRKLPGHNFLTWLLCALMPILTVTTVLASIFKGIPRWIPPREEYLIFAQAEENSIHLAEDMIFLKDKNGARTDSRNPTRIAIFLRTNLENLPPEHLTRLKKMRAKAYPYTEEDLLRIHWGLRMKKLRFFFLSLNTDLNFSRMQLFIEEVEKDSLFHKPWFKQKQLQKDKRKGIYQHELYLLSETESAPLLIDSLRRKMCNTEMGADQKPIDSRKRVFEHTDLRLLDRYRTVMYDLLLKKPLYDYADQKKNRVLILGFGRVGKAFFRAATSFCAMAGYETEFYIRDNNIDQHWHELKLQYPECGKDFPINASLMNVESKNVVRLLDKAILEKKPFTYIVLSLGDDERNIRVASRLVRYYRHRFWTNSKEALPVICVNLEDEIKSNYVSEFFTSKKIKDMLYVFGSDKDTFSEGMLLKRPLWEAARKLHIQLKEDNFVNWSEYDRRSSIACATHITYHAKAKKDYSGNELRKQMEIEEHNRWVNYSRSEGMQEISLKAAQSIMNALDTHVDTEGRLTPCMVASEELDLLYNRLYSSHKNGNRNQRNTI